MSMGNTPRSPQFTLWQLALACVGVAIALKLAMQISIFNLIWVVAMLFVYCLYEALIFSVKDRQLIHRVSHAYASLFLFAASWPIISADTEWVLSWLFAFFGTPFLILALPAVPLLTFALLCLADSRERTRTSHSWRRTLAIQLLSVLIVAKVVSHYLVPFTLGPSP